MQRSHSRDTHPFDKMYPKEDVRRLRGWSSKVKQMFKRMQQRKQRQHDTKLTKDFE